MNREPLAWTQPRAHRVSRMLAAAVLAVAGLVLLGRILDVPAVDALFSRLGIMPSDTAEAFCLAAIGLLLVRTTGWTREVGRVCLGLVAALGAMKLAQHATGLDLRIDPVLLHGPLVSDPGQPVHMSPIASLIFTLLGIGALLGARRNLPVASIGQSLLIVALLLTVHVLFGYAYGLESFYRPLTTAPMTFDAAVLFVPSTFACLYASGDRGLAAVFADPGPSGKFLRRMLPAMLVTPLLLGWAASAGRRMGYFGTGVMTAMVSTGNAVLLVGFLAWLVLSLRKADQRLRAVVEDLTASERMFRASFENAFVGMAHLDAARRWTRVNPRLAELLEYEPAALLGKRLEHLVDPEYLPLLEDRLRALQEREIDFTTGRQHWVTSQGQDRWFDVHASGRWSEDGLFKHFILVFQDVTAARRIAEQMRIQARSLEAAGTGIIITDARQSDYPIVYVNSAFERLTGYDRDEVIGSNARFLNRLAREQPELADVRQALRLGRPCSVVLQNHAKDGTPFWNELTLAPVVDDLGALTHYIGIQNDITKRLELAAEADSLLRTALEDRSRALEAARARDVLLAVVSHELRSPLNSIRLWASLLQADVSPDPATFQKALRQIDASVDAQSRLINDLLDVSRFVSGKLELEREPVDACALAKEVGAGFQPAAEAKGLRLEIRCPDGPALLDADRTRIVQIARNLIENAIKFTPRGGRVEVVVEVSDEEIELRVRDDGAGIVPEHLPRIFDQFWQGDLQSSRRQGGLGLGLSIVKFVVERHGGRVSAESGGPGRGSTFTVRLPRVQTEPHVAPPAELPEPAAPAAEGDVLVVDDERDTAEALALSLRARGLRVRVAFDVPSALAAVASQRPRIVVSDLVMPDMSGFDLLKTIREEERERGLPRIHAVAISGRGDPSDRWRVRRSGFDAFIAKPVNAQAVFQWIDGRKAKPRTLRPASLSVMVLGGEDDLLHHLRGDGHQVWQVRDLLEASRAGAQIRPDVFLVDLDAVRGNVEDLVGRLREDRLSLFVVGLSADPLKPRDGETYDSVLEKPFRAEILKRTLEQARPS